MSLKVIDRNIRTITTNANKLNTLIHTTLMLIAAHAEEHGDCTRALALVKALPASMRKAMVVLWLTTYTPIRVVEKNDKVGMLKEGQKGYAPFDLAAGDLTPFYTLAEQNPETEYDFAKLVKMVEAISKRIEKKVSEGKVKAEDVPSANAIVEKINSLSFKRVPVKPAANNDAPVVEKRVRRRKAA